MLILQTAEIFIMLRFRLLSAFFMLLAFSHFLPAQDRIPSLKADPALQRGVLPNGITYYIASNPSVKGVADVAILQRACQNEIKVRSDYGFTGGRSLGSFLAGKGVAPSSEGYVKRLGDNVLYHFSNIPVAGGDTVVDSLLLAAFRIVEKSSEEESFLGTSNQILIIAGDVDKAAFVSKMKMLSLIVPTSKAQLEGVSNVMESSSGISCNVNQAPSAVATVSIEYRMPILPESMRGTVILHINRELASMLETITDASLRKILCERMIPFSSLSVNSDMRTMFDGYDSFVVTADVASENVKPFTEAVSDVMRKISEGGVSFQQYRYINGRRILAERQSAASRESNAEYVEKCVSHILCGTDLSSLADRSKIFMVKEISDTSRLRMMNRFFTNLPKSSAVFINCRGNLAATPSDSLIAAFRGAADRGHDIVLAGVNLADTLDFAEQAEKPARPMKTKTEPISGGKQWTYQSGMNVIYKKMETGGLMHFSLTFRGGASIADSLRAYESPFLDDIFPLIDVGPLRGDAFQRLMSACGVQLTCRINDSDLTVSGVASSAGKLPLVLSALLKVSRDWSISEDACAFNASCRKLWLSSEESFFDRTKAMMDRKLYPGYEGARFMSEEGFHMDTYTIAKGGLEQSFSRFDSAVLFIAGSVNDWEVEKMLRPYVGQFPSSAGVVQKNHPGFRSASGASVISVQGDEEMLLASICALAPVTSEDVVASEIAAMALRRQINADIASSGMSAEVTLLPVLVPQDRFLCDVVIRRMQGDLLVKDTGNIRDAGGICSRAMTELCNGALTDADMKLYAQLLNGIYEARAKDPAWWEDAIRIRFAYGRDLASKPSERIKSVTKKKVLDILRLLLEGGSVECFVEK